MYPLKKLEVEPLSDQRWAKIEKSVFAQLEHEHLDREPLPKMTSSPPPRPWRWRPAVALVMAGAMAAAVGALATRSFYASPVSPVASAPSRVVTGGSDSHIALGESDVDVAPDSAVLVSGDDDRGVLVVIDRGKADVVVAPRKGRPPFMVQAGDVRVKAVVGSRFTVTRDAQGGGAHLLVANGIIDVTAHGQTTTLHDGESWPPAAAPAPAATTAQNDPPTTQAAPTTRDGKLARAPKPARKQASTAKTTIGGTPMQPVDEPPVTTANAPAPPPAASPPSLNLPPPPAAAPPPAPPAAAPAPPPGPSAQDIWQSANGMEKSNPDGALAKYKQLYDGGGAWAANALFAAGRLQHDRGNNGDAKRLLTQYLGRFPNGNNAADARDLLSKMP